MGEQLTPEQIAKLKQLRDLQQTMNTNLEKAGDQTNSDSLNSYLKRIADRYGVSDIYSIENFKFARDAYSHMAPSNWTPSQTSKWNQYRDAMNAVSISDSEQEQFLKNNLDLPGVQDYYTENNTRQAGRVGASRYMWRADTGVSYADKLNHLNEMINTGRLLQEFGNGTPANNFNNGANFNRVQDPGQNQDTEAPGQGKQGTPSGSEA